MKRLSKEELISYCKERNIDLYETMQNDWKYDQGATTAPRGTIWINNGKSRFAKNKKEIRKSGLLII